MSLLVVGCGGGGGGGSASNAPVSSTLDFPFLTAYTSFVASGYSKNYTVSGTCSGSATETVSGANGSSTFEGQSGRLSAVSTVTFNLSNCSNGASGGSSGGTQTAFYDTNYQLLGYNFPGEEYGVFGTVNIPSTVRVGNTAVFTTASLFTDSSKSTSSGRRELSYVVEPDTATTALINLISRNYNTSNQLLSTTQTRYRISSTGPLEAVSTDIQYSTTSNARLILQ